MQRAVEILLVIGILVNLIKGADLIMRPHQQKWLQDKFESWVLWLDYAKPFDWYVNNSRVEKIFWIQYVLIIPTLLSLLLLLLFIVIFDWKFWKIIIAVSLGIIADLVFTITSSYSALKSGKPLSRTAGHMLYLIPIPMLEMRLTRWLFDGETYEQHFRRHLTVVVVAFTLILSYLFIDGILIENDLNSGVMYLVSFVFGFYLIVFFVFSLTSLSLLLISLFFLFIELLLKFVRAISWRIVEYNKGAFAAIVLIVTIALGVTEFYLKYQPSAVPPTPTQTSPSPLP